MFRSSNLNGSEMEHEPYTSAHLKFQSILYIIYIILYVLCYILYILRRASSIILLENEKFFELKSKEYRDGIKRKETR